MDQTLLTFHKSVLVDEVLHFLNPQPNKLYLDVTFGSGGHTRAILQKEPTARVVALDWDSVSIEQYGPLLKEEFGDRITFLWGSFAHITKLCKKANFSSFDGILADFGTSQMQINSRAGFSVYRNTDLDMRMSPSYYTLTAAEIINTFSVQKLSEIFWRWGEERYSRSVAQAIVEQRKRRKFKKTAQLVELIEKVIPKGKQKIHPATRIFQALRIYVNKELENIKSFLHGSIDLLAPQAALVCISFHSLEDRLVKDFFKEQEQKEILRVITKKVVIPTAQEIAQNPASRSAKLRVAQKQGPS